MKEKTILRKKYMQIRDSVDEETKLMESAAITEKIIASSAYKAAATVFLYISVDNEVATHSLAARILKDGKNLAVPLCNTEIHEMQAVCIKNLGLLKTGAYGIPAPPPLLIKEGGAAIIPKTKIDIAVVPGLAFDRQKFRLGYGGGYYDKFLSDFCGCSIGIAYSKCVADMLPHESHDRAVDILITPEEMI